MVQRSDGHEQMMSFVGDVEKTDSLYIRYRPFPAWPERVDCVCLWRMNRASGTGRFILERPQQQGVFFLSIRENPAQFRSSRSKESRTATLVRFARGQALHRSNR
ncbi:MAG: hypothetical protein CSA35_05710 [Dethiosulfovibrio peptidovorans]|nr:MAG: hypothetical protein CSA35_05710 [Dethiosulfovibrio peptidovorans]